MKIPFSYLFSYWIFAWFVFYCVAKDFSKTIKTHLNPTIALYFALIENLVMLLIITIKNPKIYIIVYFIITIFLFKIVPLWYLRNDAPNIPNDFLVLIALFIFYNLYLYSQNTNIIKVYKQTASSIIHERNETPAFALGVGEVGNLRYRGTYGIGEPTV